MNKALELPIPVPVFNAMLRAYSDRDFCFISNTESNLGVAIANEQGYFLFDWQVDQAGADTLNDMLGLNGDQFFRLIGSTMGGKYYYEDH